MLQFQKLGVNTVNLISYKQLHLCRSICLHRFLRLKRCLQQQPTHLSFAFLSVPNMENKFCSSIAVNQSEEQYPNFPHNFNKAVLLDHLEPGKLFEVSKRFNLKGLEIQYIHKYNVRISTDLTTLIFPFDSLKREIVAVQTVSYKKDIEGERLVSEFLPKLGTETLFGWALVNQNEKDIVVTSNPLDAVAVNQVTDLPAISLPIGLGEFSSEVLSALKSVRKVIFWLDPHLHEWKTHTVIGSYVGGEKAFYIEPKVTPFCALSTLQHGRDMRHILKKSHAMYDEALATIDFYKEGIYEEVKDPEKKSGTKWKRFSVLNDLLKGHRKGELTIFSGQTGVGKTTFLSEYSLDLCKQGVHTLWANFEITNNKLITTMLSQMFRCSLIGKSKEDYDNLVKEFKKLPMHFLKPDVCETQTSFERALKAMSVAVVSLGVEHIVIDNLQYLMNTESFNSSLEQYTRQDKIYGAFRKFSHKFNCHITVVIHPRKESDSSALGIASISGTSKATQEADNVIVLQSTKSELYLEVFKNRYDGQKGCVDVEFDKKTLTYSLKQVHFKERSVKSITL